MLHQSGTKELQWPRLALVGGMVYYVGCVIPHELFLGAWESESSCRNVELKNIEGQYNALAVGFPIYGKTARFDQQPR